MLREDGSGKETIPDLAVSGREVCRVLCAWLDCVRGAGRRAVRGCAGTVGERNVFAVQTWVRTLAWWTFLCESPSGELNGIKPTSGFSY